MIKLPFHCPQIKKQDCIYLAFNELLMQAEIFRYPLALHSDFKLSHLVAESTVTCLISLGDKSRLTDSINAADALVNVAATDAPKSSPDLFPGDRQEHLPLGQ